MQAKESKASRLEGDIIGIMKIYNSLTRNLEEFVPFNDKKVGVYTCGPTVYDYPTIGNFRTYTISDFLVRSLKYLGYSVDYVMNLTDVGHLTGDNQGDADTGEDRLEKGAKREGKTAWEIAEFYAKDFFASFDKLNLTRPKIFAKATDHITEQIDLVKKIEEKGFAYKISDGIYFDVVAYEKAGNKYGQLSTLDQIKPGARVEVNEEKKDPRDFALWKFSPNQLAGGAKRDMQWDSPWGVGFPGWHIECSAMSIKYLGEQFDIHLGGEDLRSTHHPNEIAQSEAATGKKPFVSYWMHSSFLLVDGKRMGKSLGNAYTLFDIEKRSFSPLDLKYFYALGHFSRQVNFTWEALESAKNAREKLSNYVNQYRKAEERTVLSTEKLAKVSKFQSEFRAAIEDNLNIPKALSVAWEAQKSNIPDYDKYDLLMSFDEVFGLNLALPIASKEYPKEIQAELEKREALRNEGKFAQADEIRKKVEAAGYHVSDKQL